MRVICYHIVSKKKLLFFSVKDRNVSDLVRVKKAPKYSSLLRPLVEVIQTHFFTAGLETGSVIAVRKEKLVRVHVQGKVPPLQGKVSLDRFHLA